MSRVQRFRGRLAVLRRVHSYDPVRVPWERRTRDQQLELTEDEARRMLQKCSNLPVHVEHDDSPGQVAVGRVVAASIQHVSGKDEPELWCEYELHADTQTGQMARMLLERGVLQELSLKHSVEGSDEQLHPLEVSLVMQGARDDCRSKSIVVEASKHANESKAQGISPAAPTPHATPGAMSQQHQQQQQQQAPPAQASAAPTAMDVDDVQDMKQVVSVFERVAKDAPHAHQALDKVMGFMINKERKASEYQEKIAKAEAILKRQEQIDRQKQQKQIAKLVDPIIQAFKSLSKKDQEKYSTQAKDLEEAGQAALKNPDRDALMGVVAASAAFSPMLESMTQMQKAQSEEAEQYHRGKRARQVAASMGADVPQSSFRGAMTRYEQEKRQAAYAQQQALLARMEAARHHLPEQQQPQTVAASASSYDALLKMMQQAPAGRGRELQAAPAQMTNL